MKYFKLIIPSVLAVFMLAACTESTVDPGPTSLVLDFNTKWHSEDFHIEQVYTDQFGNRLRVDNFKSYVTMVKLIKQDGSEVLLKDFSLFDFENDNRIIVDAIEPGTYTGLQFDLGVPHEYNKNQDPAQYPNDHPLSVAGSQGMFWHWNTGYIFVKFEGKADTTGTEGADLLHSFSFHVGDDPFLRVYQNFDTPIVIEKEQTTTVAVNIAVDHILGTGGSEDIDLATDAITHTSGNTELAEKFMNNFVASISIE
ncbi:MAG: hypothetical protein JNM00_13270 [Flavobacteriales bacterium]|nr:hypothetical protein [Flavobacteriales bacterium]